ncbi:MAG: Germination protease [Thermoanaerobacterales bacterium 50_218]|nr:MAG: Germination protease [Thermoanaerobacterales bacterium 50_218]
MQELTSFLNTFGINIDLALEAKDLIRGATGREIPGVVEEKQTFPHGSVTIIKITNKQGEAIMGKPCGTYITIEAPNLRFRSPEVQESVAEVIAKNLISLLQIPEKATILIVGLGNWQATPDALGPTVVKHILITRHLHLQMPQVVANYRPVCAFAPGVLGITGIETAEIIKGVVEKVKPALIIAIDSLAATNVSRLGTTIQIGDTGISPGSGVNNKRMGINSETMGVPVIAIGVPTVVNAAIIGRMALENYHQRFAQGRLNHYGVKQVLEEIFQPFQGGLIVTPREIDDLIENAGRTVTRGINMALHPQAPKEELEALL